jgi:hypothetical protein
MSSTVLRLVFRPLGGNMFWSQLLCVLCCWLRFGAFSILLQEIFC